MAKYFIVACQLLLILCADGFAASPSHPTIIVTCASGELGTAIAEHLACDYNLILTGRQTDKLLKIKERLESQFSCQYDIYPLDYTDHASIMHFKEQLQHYSSLLGLVLMTPRPHLGKGVLKEEWEWLTLLQNTFTGPLEVLKMAVPYLVSNSSIVIIGGTTSVQCMPEYGSACVIRRMWTTCSKILSHELGPQLIRVNTLSPGVVLTHFHQMRIAKEAGNSNCTEEEQMDREAASIPLHRHAQPLEIARAVKFLLSPESSFITGTNLVIDGGKTLSY